MDSIHSLWLFRIHNKKKKIINIWSNNIEKAVTVYYISISLMLIFFLNVT